MSSNALPSHRELQESTQLCSPSATELQMCVTKSIFLIGVARIRTHVPGSLPAEPSPQLLKFDFFQLQEMCDREEKRIMYSSENTEVWCPFCDCLDLKSNESPAISLSGKSNPVWGNEAGVRWSEGNLSLYSGKEVDCSWLKQKNRV